MTFDFLPVIQPGDQPGHVHQPADDPEHSHAPAMPQRTNVLPLAPMHLKGGWHPAPVHSFTVPLWFRGTYDEQEAARSRAVILDRSHLGRFYVTGERAAEVLARVLATDARRLAPGTITRAVACREDGSILDLPTLCHLDEGRWLVISGPRAQVRLREDVAAAVQPGDDVEVRDRLTESVLLSVQGPESARLLEGVVGPTIPGAVPVGEAHEMLLGGYRGLVAHHGEMGEDGYLFLVSPEVGEHIWEQALAAQIEPAGLAAYDVMRLEAGLIEAPTETPSPATPFHAGLDDLVDFDGPEGPRAFPGAKALRALREQVRRAPLPRLLRGLRLDGTRLAKRGSRISASGEDVGACVNAAYSPVLGTGIALAYLPPHLTRVEVDTDGLAQPATIVPLPFLQDPRGTATR
ncbi:MAG: aminomethyl transferase family protein [Chloroflexi bacterium]|nr:MAG: aminomethyl transferase family protein [Chloroflexota bacterium]